VTLTLAYKHNYGLRELSDVPGGEVGVLRKNGELQYVYWLGYIDRAKATHVGKPVKLRIDRIGRQKGISTTWEEVPASVYVQGCLTAKGVFAVIEDMVRFV
jgi:hypothetical protein